MKHFNTDYKTFQDVERIAIPQLRGLSVLVHGYGQYIANYGFKDYDDDVFTYLSQLFFDVAEGLENFNYEQIALKEALKEAQAK